MWLKAIMILATIFMIYHLFYDMKIWRKSGSLIEGMDNSLDDKGRCGPLFNEKKCPPGNYCNEANGWCGVTDAHKNAQESTKYDGVSLKGRCGPLFNEQKCPPGNYCNEANGWCGVTDAHKNAQESTKYDGEMIMKDKNETDSNINNEINDEINEDNSFSENTSDTMLGNAIKNAISAGVTAAASEFIDAHMPPESKDNTSIETQNQNTDNTINDKMGSETVGTVTMNYCNVIDEQTIDIVLSQKNLIPDDMDINVYNKSKVIRVGNNFLEILKNVRNLHNVPNTEDSDLEKLGNIVINIQDKKTDKNLKNEIVKQVCTMISGIHSNEVDWNTPKLEIKQSTTGMFNDNSNIKFNQGDKASENSDRLEEQGLCLWKGCHKGKGAPLDSIWSVY